MNFLSISYLFDELTIKKKRPRYKLKQTNDLLLIKKAW